jgi:hypothetical protein
MPNDKSGMTKFARDIIKTEGLWKGLWQPGQISNATGIGIGAIGRVALYPHVRDALLSSGGYKDGQKPAFIMYGSGFISGALGYLAA